jgi:hypothetical protein
MLNSRGMTKVNLSGLENHLTASQLANLAKLNGISITVGLWEWCIASICSVSPQCLTSIEAADSVCKKIVIARVFVTIACIISSLEVMMLIVGGLLKASNTAVVLTSKGLAIATLVTGTIGMPLVISCCTDPNGSFPGMYLDDIKMGTAAILASLPRL